MSDDQFSPEAIAEYRARMRPDTVLLMAGGPQRRWPGAEPKQLADLGGETVIARLLRQLAENGVVAPVTVCETPLPGLDGVEHFASTGGYLDALAQTRDLWRGRILVLAADTVFSDIALRGILEAAPPDDSRAAFFGKRYANAYTDKTWSEIYGMRFAERGADRLVAAIDTLRAQRLRRKKLHELHRELSGLRPADRPHLPPGPLFHDVPDWTDDIDSRRDHENIIKYLKAGI